MERKKKKQKIPGKTTYSGFCRRCGCIRNQAIKNGKETQKEE